VNNYHQEAARWHGGRASAFRSRLSSLLKQRERAKPEDLQGIDEKIQDTRWWIEAEERNQAEAKAGTLMPVLPFFQKA
jgi:hypothetical protein